MTQETPVTFTPAPKSTAIDPNRIHPGDAVTVESPITPRGTDIRNVSPGDRGTVLETDRKLGGKVTMARVRMVGTLREVVFAREALLTNVERDALADIRFRRWPLWDPVLRVHDVTLPVRTLGTIRPVDRFTTSRTLREEYGPNSWDLLIRQERARAAEREARIKLAVYGPYVPYVTGGHISAGTHDGARRIDGTSRIDRIDRSPNAAEREVDYANRKRASTDAARILAQLPKRVDGVDVADLAEFLLDITA